jgi:hypothetical protein
MEIVKHQHSAVQEWVLELTAAPDAAEVSPSRADGPIFPDGKRRYANRNPDGSVEVFDIDWDDLRDDLRAVRRPSCDKADVQRFAERLRQQVKLRA